ncbi:MAG: dihydrolipoyl dehydrogenase [Ardenticatenaceae bacterium]|nr:dihydrolipoyl dehydrogenase [Ardenticatenaceae bacterium]HBY98541.1 dihydrolipoyl dehydrogenase [Chloroflexota bacterium]
MADQYDVLVIGAGPGGYTAAIRAAQLGLKTGCIEEENLGGVCLNWGCIPSKALLHNANLVYTLTERAKEFGFKFDNFSADYSVAVERSRQVVRRLVSGVGGLFKKYGVDHIKGRGTLTGPHTVTVGDKSYETKSIIIATGASWRSLPGIEVDGTDIQSYREAIVEPNVPNSVVVVGGGAIGLEFGYIYNSYGADVTIVEFLPHLAPLEDEDVSMELERAYKRRGINFRVGTKVTGVQKRDGKLHVQVEPTEGGQGETIETDRVLMAVGVAPRSSGVGLESAGVELDTRGFITIDEQMRTNVPHIYAIGDVTGKVLLAHVASHQGILAAEVIAGNPIHPMEYEMMPRATYCQPQIASMGLTEAQVKERGIEYNIGRFPFMANGKALGQGEREGFVKIIADARYGEILGAHMIGPEVTELIAEFTLARSLESTPNEIASAVHPHPTLSEVIGEAALDVEGQTINF